MTTTGEKPAWSVFLDQEEREPDADDVGRETVVFVRDLLLAPEGDESATSRIIAAMRAYHKENYCHPDDPWLKIGPSFGTGQVVGSVIWHIFGGVEYVPYDDFRHRRLADLLIELKRQAPKEINPEDLQLGWSKLAQDELCVQARESLSVYHLFPDDSIERCIKSLSTFALIAQLTGAEMLQSGVIWAVGDIDEGLVKPAPSHQTPLVRYTLATIATQYILFAAEVLAKHVADDQWKLWASKLQHLAETSTPSTDWNLKKHAQRAFEKLVEVRPELFDE